MTLGWRAQSGAQHSDATAQCLRALRDSQGDSADPFLCSYLMDGTKRTALLPEQLRISPQDHREQLRPLVRALHDNAPQRETALALACGAEKSARERSPGSGRIATSVVSQSSILSTILGVTWTFSR